VSTVIVGGWSDSSCLLEMLMMRRLWFIAICHNGSLPLTIPSAIIPIVVIDSLSRGSLLGLRLFRDKIFLRICNIRSQLLLMMMVNIMRMLMVYMLRLKSLFMWLCIFSLLLWFNAVLIFVDLWGEECFFVGVLSAAWADLVLV